MSPLNITQPWGISSIIAIQRWCPIAPKWDIYQSLFNKNNNYIMTVTIITVLVIIIMCLCTYMCAWVIFFGGPLSRTKSPAERSIWSGIPVVCTVVPVHAFFRTWSLLKTRVMHTSSGNIFSIKELQTFLTFHWWDNTQVQLTIHQLHCRFCSFEEGS